ncbi:MAG: T9SS type A sorting domain-containing protein, partial [Calditrichaeota bacterium]|nr:T9SS type A sorting domain-containing protein [Calditrichota bacterium]
RDVATLVDNAAYGDISSYISVPAASYVLDVTPGDDNTNVVAAFGADLSGLGGGAAVVFASGFLDPSMNQNGEGFGIFAALPDGNVVAFPAVSVGIEDDLSVGVVSDYELSQNYPNPFNPSTTIRYAIPAAELTTLKVYNLLGQVVATLVNEVQNAGRYQIEFDASNLASGVYLYQIQSGSYVQTRKMVLMK